jgi:hypothetical protein
METTMTKIKDLATVTVDNVFKAFPLDSERYELIGHWAQMLSAFKEGDGYVWYPETDEPFRVYTEEMLKTLGQCAAAFKRHFSQEPVAPGSIVHDRSRRVVETLKKFRAWESKELWECSWVATVEEIRDLLLECVLVHFAVETARINRRPH